MQSARNILLVGSVPFATAEAVFENCAHLLGDKVRRLPDGETGARTNWIMWQRRLVADNPGLEPLASDPGFPAPRFRVKPGVNKVEFANLGYADAALQSYAAFRTLKRRGKIGLKHKFMVALPTPLAVVAAYIEPDSQALVEPAYQARLLTELGMILNAVPHDELAVQWDIAIEFAILEGLRFVHFKNAKEGILDRLVALSEAVPSGVELGLHLCYGDSGHKHFKEPDDTKLMVEISNVLAQRIKRRIDWLHMPVPRNRADDAFFAPLKDLKLQPTTELFLGLVHMTDGLEGTKKRMATASKYCASYGVATECGLGRRKPETLPELFKIHLDAASA
ncbi:MAG: hypothetical protein AB7G15_13010 [Alphaproteobacteria bacterium]